MEVQSVETLERLAVLVADRLANIPVPQAQPLLVRIPDAAAMLGRGVSFIYEALGDGRLKGVKSDARTLVTMASLQEYASNLPPAEIKPVTKRAAHSRRKRAA
jgi:hypothetical protein